MAVVKSAFLAVMLATLAIVATACECKRDMCVPIPTAPTTTQTTTVVVNPNPTPTPVPTPTPAPQPTGTIPGQFDFINQQTSCAMTLNGGVSVLNWTPSAGAVHYYVERHDWSTGAWIRQATTTNTSYTQNVGNVDVYYRIIAVGSGGYEVRSQQADKGVCIHVEPPPATTTPGTGTPGPSNPGPSNPGPSNPQPTSCTYTLAGGSTVGQAGGNIGVSVVVNPKTCTWTASSGSATVIVGAGSHTGDGSVVISIPPGGPATFTAFIAGQTYTVTRQ